MAKLVLTTVLSLVWTFALASAPAQDQKQPTREAKARFIKKCFRDRTPASCEAPPEARNPKH